MRGRFVVLSTLVCCSRSNEALESNGVSIATLSSAQQLVVDDDVAYVAGGNGQNGTGIVRVPLDGGATSMFVVTDTNVALAMDDSSIYFTSGGVSRIDKDASSTELITDAAAESVALDDAFVYWRSEHAITRASSGPASTTSRRPAAMAARATSSERARSSPTYTCIMQTFSGSITTMTLVSRACATSPRHDHPAREKSFA